LVPGSFALRNIKILVERLKGSHGPENFLPSLGPCSMKEGDVDYDSAALNFIMKVMFDALNSANGGSGCSIALASCKVYLCKVCFPGLI
jgi:hypothetical protein